MPSGADSTPILPFENPGHALIFVGCGLAAWMIGTAIRTIGGKPEQMREITRHNPWYNLFRGRLNTAEEEKKQLPNAFFHIYGGMGQITVWISYLFFAFGFSGLIVSLGKKLF